MEANGQVGGAKVDMKYWWKNSAKVMEQMNHWW